MTANGSARSQFAAGGDGGLPCPGGHNRKVPPLPTRKSYFLPAASTITQYPLTRAWVYAIPGSEQPRDGEEQHGRKRKWPRTQKQFVPSVLQTIEPLLVTLRRRQRIRGALALGGA